MLATQRTFGQCGEIDAAGTIHYSKKYRVQLLNNPVVAKPTP
jgi:hypothetical protein